MAKSGCPFYADCTHRADEECQRRYKESYYMDAALIPASKRGPMPLVLDRDFADEAAFVRLAQIESSIEEFVRGGKNLYIYSSTTGNGKTSWAYRMLKSYIDKVWNKRKKRTIALFVSVPKFLSERKSSFSEKSEYIDHVFECRSTCDLIVWDDIGTKVGTEFEDDLLYQMINERIENGKSNIYTSNLDAEDIGEFLGSRLYSRVFNSSEQIELRGLDKRGLRDDS